MKLGRLFGIDIKLHIAFPALMLLLHILGKTDIFMIIVVLVVHELAHCLCAKALNVRVVEMELMPFGAVARLDSVLGISPKKECAISLAGPFLNLLLMMAAMTCRWYFPSFERALAAFADINRSLLLINIMPVLPLDGGRALRSLLAVKLGLKKATTLCARLGMVLAILILIIVAIGIIQGELSITGLVVAIYLYYAASKELNESSALEWKLLWSRRDEFAQAEIMPIKIVAATESTLIADVLHKVRPGSILQVSVLGEDMLPLDSIYEGELLQAFLNDPSSSLCDIMKSK